MCQPHWDENNEDGPVNPGPPFIGGQCTARYQFNATVIVPGVGTAGVARTIVGPLQSVTVRARGQTTEMVFVCRTVGPTGCGGSGGTTTPVQTIVQLLPVPWEPGTAIGTVTLTPCPGQPNNCGNPPDAPLTPGPNPPPNPGPQPGPEPTDDPDGGPIPIIPIPPFDDPTFGPQPFEPGDAGAGGEPQPPAPPAGGDGLPGSPDSVEQPAGSTGDDGEGEDFDFGEPPEGKIWVGAIVEATVPSSFGNIPGTGPGNTVYPYVIGNASLIYSGGRGSSSRMRSRFHEMFRPVTALEVTGARVQCRPSVIATVRPVSATICPENTCGVGEDG